MLSTDPTDLLLDDGGDLLITTDLQFSSGLTGVRQAVQFALGLFKEEWFLDLDVGIPYFQELLAKKFNPSRARDIFRTEILSVPGVKAVDRLDVTFDGPSRTLTVSCETSTVFGDSVEEFVLEI